MKRYWILLLLSCVSGIFGSRSAFAGEDPQVKLFEQWARQRYWSQTQVLDRAHDQNLSTYSRKTRPIENPFLDRTHDAENSFRKLRPGERIVLMHNYSRAQSAQHWNEKFLQADRSGTAAEVATFSRRRQMALRTDLYEHFVPSYHPVVVSRGVERSIHNLEDVIAAIHAKGGTVGEFRTLRRAKVPWIGIASGALGLVMIATRLEGGKDPISARYAPSTESSNPSGRF